jgi:hypothetical protein
VWCQELFVGNPVNPDGDSLISQAGCDHSRFLFVPDWYANDCRVLALVQTYSILNVYLVIKIKFIKYRFLKSMFKLRVRTRSTNAYTNNGLQRFLAPSFQSCFMPRHLRHRIYQLNYGIEYLGLGKVMCKYAYNRSSARTYVVRGWKQRSTRP